MLSSSLIFPHIFLPHVLLIVMMMMQIDGCASPCLTCCRLSLSLSASFPYRASLPSFLASLCHVNQKSFPVKPAKHSCQNKCSAQEFYASYYRACGSVSIDPLLITFSSSRFWFFRPSPSSVLFFSPPLSASNSLCFQFQIPHTISFAISLMFPASCACCHHHSLCTSVLCMSQAYHASRLSL